MGDLKAFYIQGDDLSDGYHTFTELYAHRTELFLALCRSLSNEEFNHVWRSQKHHDDTMYDGWFILGVHTRPHVQITYHIPMSRWDDASFAETLPWAPPYDGHTPDDVLRRLKSL